jgi:1,2-diacylglycerol 3-alpha-glucosyltransferase
MVIDSYDDSKNGAVISTKRFVRLLRDIYDITIITTGAPGPGKVLVPAFYPVGVKKIMKKMHTPLGFPSHRVLKKAIREADIVHIQFPFLLAMNSVRIARKMEIPVISTFHIQAEHLAMNAGIHSEKFIRLTYKLWINKIYNKSDMVICPSRFAEEELKNYGLTAPSVVLSNGILPMFRPMPVQRPELMKDRFIILSVGRFAPEKRQELIIHAIGKSAYRENIQLILIGQGPIQEKLSAHGESLPNRPVFLTLQEEELVPYYNMADLYIHAATVEVECMSVLEAMGCGLPVLIADSRKSATKQFAISPDSLFTSDDPDDLSKKIDYWIENPDKLKKQKELYFMSSQHYRIENSFEKLVEVYRGVAKD